MRWEYVVLKNKKLIATAIGAAIVLSMQASNVFAGEVSDSDMEMQEVPAQVENSLECGGTEQEETVVDSVENDAEDLLSGGIDVDYEYSDVNDDGVEEGTDQSEMGDLTVDEDQSVNYDNSKYYGDDVQNGESEDPGNSGTAEEAGGQEEVTDSPTDESTEEPTIEDIQSLIDGFIDGLKSDPEIDESEIEQTRQLLNDLFEEITQSDKFAESGATLADVEEYFQLALEELGQTDTGETDTGEVGYVTSGKCGENLTWEFDEETNTLTIRGSGDMYDFNDYEYMDYWWSDVCDYVENIVFEGDITSISGGALVGLGIETIDIPASVKSIGGDAFGLNEKLRSINVADGNKNYQSRDGVLFDADATELLIYPAAKSGESYKIPDTVVKIGDSAFSCCNNLISVVIPDSVTVIGAGAFDCCRYLTDVKMGDSVTRIDVSAFSNCVELDEIILGNSVQFIDCVAFYGSGLTKVTLPHWIKSIEYGAFDACNLNDVYYIGTREEWEALGLIEFEAQEGSEYPVLHFTPSDSYQDPVELVEIEEDVFRLDEETIAEIETLLGEFMDEVKSDEQINAEQAEEMENYLTEWFERVKKLGSDDPELAEGAFNDLSAFFYEFLQDIVGQFTDQFETSGKCGDDLTWEFDMETGILTITGNGDMYEYDVPGTSEGDSDGSVYDESTPEGVIKQLAADFFNIYGNSGDDMFGNYDGEYGNMVPWFEISELIKGVKFVGNITSISSGAFMYCDFASIDIPASVKWIGEDVFTDNYSLKSINVANDNENYSSAKGVLFDKAAEKLILYPLKKTDKTYTVPDTVKTIAQYAFFGCSYLTKVVIPDSVIDICESAFDSCYQLAEVTIGNSVKSIGVDAFMDCYKLKKLKFGNSVESIGEMAFSGSGLREITIPESVVFVSSDAFTDCYINNVYYLGTESDWNKIDFHVDENSWFDNESQGESDPAVFGTAVIHYQQRDEKPSAGGSGSTGTGTENEGNEDNAPSADKENNTEGDVSKPVVSKPAKDSLQNPKTGEESTVLPFIALIASAVCAGAALIVSLLRKLREN